MARFSRGMKAPIHSIKHYLNHPKSTIATGTVGYVIAVNAIAKGAARASSADVEEGAVVKAVYMEYWLSNSAIDNAGTWCVLKAPVGVGAPIAADMANLGSYVNKKNILESGQGLLPSGGTVVPILRKWIAVPKGKQRMGLGDRFILAVHGIGGNTFLCGLTTYKEYE